MSEQAESAFLRLAVMHGMLTREQASEVETASREQGLPCDRIATKQGFLSAVRADTVRGLMNPTDVAPGYRVNRVLGHGGFGVVYQATQQNMSREVALKTIPLSQLGDETATRRFEREAKIVGQLRHPHIVTAYDFGMHNERLYLSMELVEGNDLEQALVRFGKLNEFITWHLLRQVVMALAYAAGHDITHRDIKPGNLMVTEPPMGYAIPDGIPMVKVTDFGLACFSQNRPLHSNITMANVGLGTPSYVAPEQMTGSNVDARADIYALGATAFHMLTGHPPMHDSSPMEVIAAKVSGDTQWLESMPADWTSGTRQLIARMADFDADKRIPDHQTLLTEMDEVLESLPDRSVSAGRSLMADMPRHTVSEGLSSDGEFELAGDTATRSQGDAASAGKLAPTPSHEQTTREFSAEDQTAPRKTLIHSVKPPAPAAARQVSATRKWLTVGGIIGLIAIAAVVMVNAWIRPPRQAPEVELQLSRTPPTPLFNGVSLDFRQKSTGSWELAADEEGGSVLAGNGSRIFPCVDSSGAPLTYFRFSIGFRFNDANEIRLMIQRDTETEYQDLVIANNTGIVFGREDQTTNTFEAHGDHVGWPTIDDSSLGYFNIHIERHHNYWLARLDNRLLGRVHDESQGPAKIKLVVVGGKAWFENIFLRELAAPPSDEALANRAP